MVKNTGKLNVEKRDGGAVEIQIEVVPWQPSIVGQLNVWGGGAGGGYLEFGYELTRQFTKEGRACPLVRSSLGTEVSLRSRELWRVPSMGFADLIFIMHNARPFKSPTRCAPEKEYDIGALISFFEEGCFESELKILSVRPSCITFIALHFGAPLSVDCIDAFIDIGRREFGAYSNARLMRQARKGYLETNSVELGYVAQEESC